jgi:hypothetical protein
MPKTHSAPVVLTLQQQLYSWRNRAETLRSIAAASRDQAARAVLTQRAEAWEKRAAEAERQLG